MGTVSRRAAILLLAGLALGAGKCENLPELPPGCKVVVGPDGRPDLVCPTPPPAASPIVEPSLPPPDPSPTAGPVPTPDPCGPDGQRCSPPPKPSPTAGPASPAPTTTPGTPAPGPRPTPAACPPLVKWGSGLHAQMTPQHQGIPKSPTFAGNTIDFDSTARFGSGRGQPCNDEHHAPCEVDGLDNGPTWRRCEDPRGPDWTVVSCRGERFQTINEGWGFRVVGVERGSCSVKACPRSDVQDAEGQPVRVLGDTCTVSTVNVE